MIEEDHIARMEVMVTNGATHEREYRKLPDLTKVQLKEALKERGVPYSGHNNK